MAAAKLTPEQEFHQSTTPLTDMDPHSLYRWTIERLLDEHVRPNIIEFKLENLPSTGGGPYRILQCTFRYKAAVYRARRFVFEATICWQYDFATNKGKIVSSQGLVTFSKFPPPYHRIEEVYLAKIRKGSRRGFFWPFVISIEVRDLIPQTLP